MQYPTANLLLILIVPPFVDYLPFLDYNLLGINHYARIKWN